jgi:hypothetical protein
VIVGGGLRLLGPRLLDGIRTALDSWAAQSPFIDMLELSGRVQLLAADSSAAAVGAALASEGRRR